MEPASSDQRWRILLVLAGVGVPAFGLLHWWELGAEPTLYVAMRAVISVTAFAVLVGSFVDPRVRARLRTVGLGIAYWVQGWFIVVAIGAGMGQGQIVGILLISTLTALLFRSAAEVVAYAGFSSVVAGVAYATGADVQEVRPGLFVATTVMAIGGVGSISVSRARLEEALLTARADLERRVLERTADLHASLRRLEQEVAERIEAERHARAANQAKSTFLANMSHELRTPLNAILGYTELVQEDLIGSNAEHVGADLDRVQSSAGHLLRLIDDVLDLSRIEAGHLEVHRQSVDLAAVVGDVVAELDRKQSRNGNRLAVAIPPGTLVRSDPRILAQIIANLLSNAFKFTTGGEVRVVAEPGPNGLSLSVEDTGVGIAASAMDRLFQKFAQLDDSPTRRYGGTGLGLALCRELALRLGGVLTVRSTLGQGSTFTLALPGE